MPVRSSQEDFLLRELRKVAAMIARAMGFRTSGDLPAARVEIEHGYVTLLGPQASLLRMLDVQSSARLIADSRKVSALARLTAAEAALAADNGKPDEAKQLLLRAKSLAREAVEMDPNDEEAQRALEELLALCPSRRGYPYSRVDAPGPNRAPRDDGTGPRNDRLLRASGNGTVPVWTRDSHRASWRVRRGSGAYDSRV